MASTKASKMGRPPRTGTAATERFWLRVTASHKAKCEIAAAREGKSLTEWILAATELALARGSTR